MIMQLDKINAEKPYEEMTVRTYWIICVQSFSSPPFMYSHVQVDEYLADKPDLKKQADEDTKNQNWHFGTV